MTREEFLRLPRFLSDQDDDEQVEVVAVSSCGILPITHCSESEEARSAVPLPSSFGGQRPLFATQLWISVDKVLSLLDDPDALAEPTSIHDAGPYGIIVDGHHREVARRISA